MTRNSITRLGLIVPSSNTTMEAEVNKLVPENITVHSARMRMKEVTPEELKRMDEESVRAAKELSDASVSAIAYGCTIAVMSREVGYDGVVQARIEGAVRTPTIVSATAVMSALRALQIKRVAVATPYLDSVAQLELDYMEKSGFEIAENKNLNIADNLEVGNQRQEVAYDLVNRLDISHADGVLISCAQLPSAGVIGRLEQELEKPVLSTNTATLWAIFRRIGLDIQIQGYGRLLSETASQR